MIALDTLPPLVVWMSAAVAFGALVALAAAGAERGLRLLRMPTRHVWSTAIAVGTVWPLLAALFFTRQPPPAPGEFVIMGAPVAVMAAPAATTTTDWGSLAANTALLVWCALSALLVIRLVRGSLALRRVQDGLRVRRIDGETVLVSDAVGPAAIGVRDPRIIVPEWTLELESGLRALVLRHEREHCRAGDPAVLWGASLATALAPWNPALWYLARRLRLAMEVDCDARTLAAAGATANDDVRRRYARVLMLIAQRNTMTPHAPMLVDTPSQLSRRISAMNAMPARHPVLRALAAGAVALLAITAACSQRIANGLAGPASPNAARTGEPTSVDATSPVSAAEEKPYFDFQVDKPVVMAPGSRGPRYPDALRAARVEGTVLAQFVVRADGSVDRSSLKVLKTSHQQFSESVVDAIFGMTFLAAEKGGRKVSQLVQQPFMFSLPDTPAGTVGTTLRAQTDTLLNEQRMAERLKQTRAQTDSFVTSFPVTKEMEASVNAELARMQRERPTQVPANATLFDFQTERPAMPVANTKGPEYPAELRTARTEGSVLIQVVVDENGQPMMGSFKVLKSDHALFSEAVKTALAATQFTPAKVGGKSVRQLVQLPFQFSLSR